MFAMPSSKFTNLNLGASGSSYTAPANGYVDVVQVNSGSGICNLYCTSGSRLGSMITIAGAQQACKVYILVKKGDTFVYAYTGRQSSADNFFVFIYAEGEI